MGQVRLLCRLNIGLLVHSQRVGNIFSSECSAQMGSGQAGYYSSSSRNDASSTIEGKGDIMTQVTGIDIVMDWLVQHPTDQYTHLKVQDIHSFMLAFSLSHLRVFSAHYFVKLPPIRNSHPGSHGTAILSLPHYRTCLRFNREEKKSSESSFLPWCPLVLNWCAFM